jgi:uncharacterized protein (DUF1330 family)
MMVDSPPAQVEMLPVEAATAPGACDGRPVLMVVTGPTHDRKRMAAYAKAIADSGLYARLGGYYVNGPRPLTVFEGAVPANHATLIVRFPCLANARAFWHSKVYQETIKPLRLDPSAGDYSVTVYAESDVPAYLKGQVSSAPYTRRFDPAAVEQVGK